MERRERWSVVRGPSRHLGRVGSLAFGMAAGLLGSSASTASACGFENPEIVALGTLNWAFPNALYVSTAVWQAEDAGLLPPRGKLAAPGPLSFYRAAAAMKRIGATLQGADLAGAGTALSIVLIPQVMWTRFDAGPSGVSVKSHADGPAGGDVVIVTSEKVIQALLEGSLDAASAEAYGLMRLYGDQGQVASVRTVMARASQATPTKQQQARALDTVTSGGVSGE